MKIFAFLFAALFTCAAIADDYIVIVFDTSGSMNDYMRVAKKTRIEVAQDSLISVLSKVPSTTQVGILSFKGWIYDLQPVDQQKAEEAIRSTRPGGGTPLYQYIALGATRLLEERKKQDNIGSYKLLVVTDGVATDDALNRESWFEDRSSKPGVLKDVLNRGIIVDAIGLEMAGNHPLSAEINGTYMRGDDPKSLTTAISKSVAEVGFGATKDTSDDAFAEISELPDGFVMAALKGLTTFENHPIGEKAPPTPIATSQVETNPVPVQQVAASDESHGGTIILLVGLGAAVLIFGAFIVAGRS